MMEPPRPPPPEVGKVTHHTIQLCWQEAMERAVALQGKGDGKLRVCVQEQDQRLNSWGNVYVGYARYHEMTGLEESTTYKYRIRFMNDIGPSEWSGSMAVSSIKAPLTGEDLHRAVKRNRVDVVERIIESRQVNIDVNDKFGFSPLMQASRQQQPLITSKETYIPIMELLLVNGAEVNRSDDSGKTSLMMACFAGNLEAVQLLRSYGADYNTTDKGGSSAIHWAVDGCNTELIDWMISDGIDINTRNSNIGWTPIMRNATLGGNKEVAELLVSRGANVNCIDNDGKTPLMVATINGHKALVSLLLKHGADISAQNEYGKTVYEMALSMEKRPIIKLLEEHMDKLGIKHLHRCV